MGQTRREFMAAGTVAMTSLPSDLQLQLESGGDNPDYRGVAFLVGPSEARPSPGGSFFDDKVEPYAFIYEDENGARSYITDQLSQWQPLNYIQQVNVFDSSDLPEPTNGTHTLTGQTAYFFNGFVTSQYGLDISNGPALLGRHASMDGFIHTGQQTAITGSGGGYFQDSLYVHAPGGRIWNISGDQTTEMLVTDSAFSDAAGIAPIADLGVIDGLRVPTLKNCNVEDFNSGLTFDGSPDKIFVTDTPFRTVTTSGVDILTLASTCDVNEVDFVNNYIKDVQPDTVVWRVESGGEPNEVHQYRGTLHDTSFTPDNAIVGPNASPTVEPFWVNSSHPVRDSSVAGELYLTQDKTVAIDTQDQWYEVNGITATGNESERVTQPNNGTIQYVGTKDVNVQVNVRTAMTGANGRTYEIGIAKNGTVEPASAIEVEAQGSQAAVNPGSGAIEDLEPGETLSVQVRNRDGTEDATFRAYILSFMD